MESKMTWKLAALAVFALLLAACSAEAPTATDEAGSAASDDAGPSAVASDDATEEAGPSAVQDPPSDAADEDPPSPSDDAGVEEQPGGIIDVRTDHPVDAHPGRWAVGDAGYVEWDHTSDGLVLLEVSAEDGWSWEIDEEADDEIEVEFRREDTEIEIEVELDDGRVEIEIRADIDPAEAGVYDLGQAGSFEFTVDGERLVLVDLVVVDGWQEQVSAESDDEVEFVLRSGNESWEVELELDDGNVELEIDYEVDGRVAG
jgi:hypothetical protein